MLVPDPGADREAFVEAVERATRAVGPSAIIPVHDGSIEALRAHRSRFPQLALASEAALDVATSKARTYAAAMEIGIRVPTSMAVSNSDELRTALAELGAPLVVKPDRSWYWSRDRGMRVAPGVGTDRRSAEQLAAAIWDVGGSVELQEVLPGRREAVSLMRAGGRIRARFAQAAERTLPPLGGASITRRSITFPPDAGEIALRLVEAIDLDGYSEVEFRRAGDGEPVLMEVNPRLSASVEVAVRAGVDFPAMVYAWVAGDALEAVDGYEVGVRMRWLGGDIARLRSALANPEQVDVHPRAEELRAFVGDFARRTGYDYVANDDLKPAVRAFASATGRASHEIAARLAARGPVRG
ncbi:MAG TPA: ATP-grasp domain-containing protein [Acidimicrobiia bacterium]|nr:ATP-grasp domain-containing protein [Acidimicrobiia bacterium]